MTVTPTPNVSGELPAAQDFYRLRREGIGHVQRAASAVWTDYNTHDSGITLLEATAYAITELGYRAEFPIEDLLASAPGATPADRYPGQAFPTARRILTVNPVTTDDLRRLLIDADAVRNAWVRAKQCGCDNGYYAWCEDGELVLSYEPSPRDPVSSPVAEVHPRGLYDVVLELEADDVHGDLNDATIVRRRSIADSDGNLHALTAELHFPGWRLADREERQRFAAGTGAFTVTAGPLTDAAGRELDGDGLRRNWSGLCRLSLEVTPDNRAPVAIGGVGVRVFGDSAARDATTVADLTEWLTDSGTTGFVHAYRGKLGVIDDAIAQARQLLAAHRNLDEDFCRVDLVEIADIAVCADVEVAADADLELVQATIWYEIERYLDPPVEYISRDEALARGVPVDELFNGPELSHGLLTDDGLRAAELRTEIRSSDILNKLMDVDGVISVQNLLLTAYAADGTPITGAADPSWHDGQPDFEPYRLSASWLLMLRPDQRPRLHRRLSRFLFLGNGLPFRPRLDEAEQTLIELHGRAARGKQGQDLDLPLPVGRRRDLTTYHPVQNSLPQTYGVGPAGLPTTADALRRTQALQLKGYLMVFEQLLRNASAQVARFGDLFSLDPAVRHSYVAASLDPEELDAALDPDARRDATITDYAELVGATLEDRSDPNADSELDRLVEPERVFVERRNRFLDHLLARFGESFAAHAMLFTDADGLARARSELIDDKLAFLAALPELGHDRGRAFDRTRPASDPGNAPGLKRRVELLLGLPRRPHWEEHRRTIVVEHLLLRPKFPGDALYPACTDGTCHDAGCGDADPYSFRLTYVLPGWTAPFNTDLTARRFAERTIQEQTPAHLLVKTCWVADDAFDRFEDAWLAWREADALVDWTVERLPEAVAEILTAGLATPDTVEAVGNCAAAMLTALGQVFGAWLDDLVAAGESPDQAAPIPWPDTLPECGLSFQPGVIDAVLTFARDRYSGYVAVSYRLRLLVRELAGLRNTYPRATLHDCDAGSDANPVRLGHTALGSIDPWEH